MRSHTELMITRQKMDFGQVAVLASAFCMQFSDAVPVLVLRLQIVQKTNSRGVIWFSSTIFLISNELQPRVFWAKNHRHLCMAELCRGNLVPISIESGNQKLQKYQLFLVCHCGPRIVVRGRPDPQSIAPTALDAPGSWSGAGLLKSGMTTVYQDFLFP